MVINRPSQGALAPLATLGCDVQPPSG